jgi:hypothetical protein
LHTFGGLSGFLVAGLGWTRLRRGSDTTKPRASCMSTERHGRDDLGVHTKPLPTPTALRFGHKETVFMLPRPPTD